MNTSKETYVAILEPSGIWRVEPFREGESLKQMQEAVGGLVDCMETPIENVDMWVNDEFLFLPAEDTNPKACAFMNTLIRGAVFFALCDAAEGSTVGMSYEGIAKLIVAVDNAVTDALTRLNKREEG